MQVEIWREGMKVNQPQLVANIHAYKKWVEKEGFLTHLIYPGKSDVWLPDDGIWLRSVHLPDDCAPGLCTFHNPSRDHMKDWPLHWRVDRSMFERICGHGIGHPSAEQYDYWFRTYGDQGAGAASIHGCDGCCYERTSE